MSTISAPRTAPKPKRATSECCANPECEAGRRNRYFLGKQLSPYSFQAEQRYALERRRLLNRAIHGWGVAYGFKMTLTPSGLLAIEPGLALDQNGRELLQAEKRTYAAGDLIVFDKDGHISDLAKISYTWNGAAPECWLLSAHYAEQDIDAVKVNDPCQCERMEWNYTCETIRFSLQSQTCSECCKGQACEWNGGCASTGWCGQPDGSRQRGGHQYLCEHITALPPGSAYDKLCELDEPCGSVRVDLHNGVPLACVKLVLSNCDGWIFDGVDTCGPRRLVKGNDVLFDLIQGCDLTKISEIGWKWHRQEKPQVSFPEFSLAFGINCKEHGDRQPEYVTDKFWVKFSRPVSTKSLQPDCFAMTVMNKEREGGWWQTYRVPIARIDTEMEHPREGDPPGYARSARIVVDGAWAEDALCGSRSLFQGGETWVEIEVRGDFILDCNGQAVDANAVGYASAPTGNGTPGGTFLSAFLVEQAPPPKRLAPDRPVSYEGGNPQKGVSS